MRRLIFALSILIASLSLASVARASASTSTVIQSPDCLTTAPGAGCVYVQAGTLGVKIINPTGQALAFTSTDIAGGAAVQISQSGVDGFSGNYVSTVPVRALLLGPGVVTFLSAATQLPAPDLTFTSATGGVSYNRVSTVTNGLDWTGGFGTPATVGGASPFGTVTCMLNNSGGGQTINVLDLQMGGAVHVPAPSVTLGFQETMCFIYDNSGWEMLSRGGSYYFSGGEQLGGRVVTTTDATVTPIMRYVKGSATTPGIGVRCDIAAQLSGGTGTTAGWWLGVTATWDGSNNLRSSSKGTTSGTNAGALPASWDLSFTTDGTYNNINVIGVAATTIAWRANNCVQVSAPF